MFPSNQSIGWKVGHIRPSSTRTNVRKSPDINSEIVTQITTDQPETIYEWNQSHITNKKWLPVVQHNDASNKIQGWVHIDYVATKPINLYHVCNTPASSEIPLPELYLSEHDRAVLSSVLYWLATIIRLSPYRFDDVESLSESQDRMSGALMVLLTSILPKEEGVHNDTNDNEGSGNLG